MMILTWWMVVAFFLSYTYTQGRSVGQNEQLSEESGPMYSISRAIQGVIKQMTSERKSEYLIRVKKSQVLTILVGAEPENRCSSNSSCVRRELSTDVPSELAYCDLNTGLCVCSDCFVRLNNTCQVFRPLCKNFSTDTGACVDNRKSQEIAFLLSIFLSSVGAANFYIGQYLLASIQLGLLVLTIALAILTLCLPFCVFICTLCVDEDYIEDECTDHCVRTTKVFGVLICIALFTIACWWVADLSLFAYNGRTDSNGCSLLADL